MSNPDTAPPEWAMQLALDIFTKIPGAVAESYAVPIIAAALVQVRGQALEEAQTETDQLRAELVASDQLIQERNKVLEALECETHGQCVPGALDKIQKLRGEVTACEKDRDRYLSERDEAREERDFWHKTDLTDVRRANDLEAKLTVSELARDKAVEALKP